MAKKKAIMRNVLTCFIVFAILMSVMPVSIFAMNSSNNATEASNHSNDLEKSFILPLVSNDTGETVSALSCDVYVKIDDGTCVGYDVYVDGVYQFTEGQSGTPDGYCAFYVSTGTHKFELRKNGCTTSKSWYCQCGTVYRWVSMPDYWCECGGNGNCDNPPTVKFDKSKYYEADTVHATVSTIHNSVYYEIKDCSGMVRESGYVSNGETISYTIPSSASECCYWEICFYWNEWDYPDLGSINALDVHLHECSRCYTFYVCPKTTCEVYVIIDGDTCVGYEVYVDGVYQFTEGQDGTPDGYCAFYVTPGTHKFELRKNGCTTSKSWYCQCGTVYRWVSMPDYWCEVGDHEEACPSEVKFKGTAKTDELTGLVCYGTYYCDVVIDQILHDPDNSLKVGTVYTVGYGNNPKYIKSGDKIEVNGSFYHSCGPLNQMGRICGDVNKSSHEEVKFRGKVTGTEELIGARHWYVSVDEWISGSLPCDEVDVALGIYPPMGSCDENIRKGDRVEVYGVVNPWGGDECTVGLNGESYYIKKIETCGKILDYVINDGTYPPGQIVRATMLYKSLMSTPADFKGVFKVRSPTGEIYSNSKKERTPAGREDSFGYYGDGDVLDRRIPEDASTGWYDAKLELRNYHTDELCDETKWMENQFRIEEFQEIKFVATAIERCDIVAGADYWIVTIDEILSGPTLISGNVTVYIMDIFADSPIWGYADPNITVGDKVEVYGRLKVIQLGQYYVTLNGCEDYYIKRTDAPGLNGVKFRGFILVDHPIISFYSFDIQIDEILNDPNSNLQIGETVNVYGHRDGPAHVDNVTVGDRAEVFGEYQGYVGTYERIFLSDYLDNSSDHYVKKLLPANGSINITSISPPIGTTLIAGYSVTFTVTVDYDLGQNDYGKIRLTINQYTTGTTDKEYNIGTFDPPSGSYTFTHTETIGDDWENVYVSVSLYAAKQGEPLPAEYTDFDYKQYPVGGGDCFETVPSDHWKGEYYNNKNLEGSPSMVRDDGTGYLNFDWDVSSPSTSCGIGSDFFSVRWTRTLNFDSGTWRFTATTDDGMRVYVDGSLVIDKWFNQLVTTYTADVDLNAGTHTIKVEYYEHDQTAVAKLSWEKGSGPGDLELILFDPEVDGLHVKINGVVYNAIKPLHWDWGDGTQEESWFAGEHTYSAGGSYTVTVTAYGEGNAEVTKTVIVKVSPPSSGCGEILDYTISDGTYPPGQIVRATMLYKSLMSTPADFKGVFKVRSPTGEIYSNSKKERTPAGREDSFGYYGDGDVLDRRIPEDASTGWYDAKLELRNYHTDELCDETKWMANQFKIGDTSGTCINFDELSQGDITGQTLHYDQVDFVAEDALVSDFAHSLPNGIQLGRVTAYLKTPVSWVSLWLGNWAGGTKITLYASDGELLEDVSPAIGDFAYYEFSYAKKISKVVVFSAEGAFDDFCFEENCTNVSKIIKVDDDFIDDPPHHKWDTIQEGMADASEGDTVIVYSGTYYNDVVVNKSRIALKGVDNPVVKGGGFLIAPDGYAIENALENVIIEGFNLTSGRGIWCFAVNNSRFLNNTITHSGWLSGMLFEWSHNNTIVGNEILDSNCGVQLFARCTNNTIIGNAISNNSIGINLVEFAGNNTIYHNNFINNTVQAMDDVGPALWGANRWNNSYPSGGNYWSDYDEASEGAIDVKGGPDQNQAGSDGIADSPYDISGSARVEDNYPLMKPRGEQDKIDYWAVIVGMSDAPWGDKDANDLYNALLSSSNWKEDHIHLLIDATKENIKFSITDWMNSADENDVCLFFYSGHGKEPVPDMFDPDGYLGEITTQTNDIADFELAEWMEALKTNNIVVIISSCHSGAFIGNFEKEGCVILTACAALEGTHGYPSLDSGMFSFFVIQGLYGAADINGDREISVEEIFSFSEPRIVEVTKFWGSDGSYQMHPQKSDKHEGELELFIMPMFSGIQKLVNEAQPGEEVKVPPGTYQEHVIVDKPLRLISDDATMDCSNFGCIFVKNSDVTIDGFTLKKGLYGIYLDSTSNVRLNNNILTGSTCGIYVLLSDNNKITKNTISSNTADGVLLFSSNENTIARNTISDNDWNGLAIGSSTDNSIISNDIFGNRFGIFLSHSNNNLVYHNNLTANDHQGDDFLGTNSWDNGYPSGGNYWNDYVEKYKEEYNQDPEDKRCGHNQDEACKGDVIWDRPYQWFEGDAGAKDNYPLMKPWGDEVNAKFVTNGWPDCCSVSDGTYKPGDIVRASCRVENTGSAQERFVVVFNVKASDGTIYSKTSRYETILPGRRHSFLADMDDLLLRIPHDANTGFYAVKLEVKGYDTGKIYDIWPSQGWKEDQFKIELISSNEMVITAFCLVNLSITGPEGFTINKQLNEILNATYIETDINGDGNPDGQIIIPDRKIGDYKINIIPKPDAEPTDTFTLEVIMGDTSTVLAENVPVSEIPAEPYIFKSGMA